MKREYILIHMPDTTSLASSLPKVSTAIGKLVESLLGCDLKVQALTASELYEASNPDGFHFAEVAPPSTREARRMYDLYDELTTFFEVVMLMCASPGMSGTDNFPIVFNDVNFSSHELKWSIVRERTIPLESALTSVVNQVLDLFPNVADALFDPIFSEEYGARMVVSMKFRYTENNPNCPRKTNAYRDALDAYSRITGKRVWGSWL